MVGRAGEAMPFLESNADPSAIRRILLATGLGAIFGFQSRWLAEHGIAVSDLWCGPAWILLSHVFLGFSIGVTAGSERWWRRGLVLGLVFSIPSAFGVLAPGVRWVPDGVAVVAIGLAAGMLIALIVDALSPSTQTANGQYSPVPETGNDDDEVVKLRVDNRNLQEIVDDELEEEPGEDQDTKRIRFDCFECVPPGFTDPAQVCRLIVICHGVSPAVYWHQGR